MSLKIYSLRWKIIALFGISLVLSLASVSGLVQLARQYGIRHRSGAAYLILKRLQTGFGVLPLGAIAGLLLFILFFFLLSRGGILYLERISRTLQQISLGRLDAEIPPRPPDELGELADNINRMTARLKASLAEERQAERGKRELVASVSHDLRTPLTSILGYLELMDRDAAAAPEELRRYAGIALSKSRQLQKLIDRLFEYTKVSGGELAPRLARIDLKALLLQLAEEHAPALAAARMAYRLAAPEDGYFVQADGDLLVRVFENLLSNAVRYGRRGRLVELILSRDGADTVAEVVNFGDPIPAASLPRLFDRFFRPDGSRADRAGGAGLGLAIAKSIVDLHGGDISVRSDAARTAFRVRLKSDAEPGAPV